MRAHIIVSAGLLRLTDGCVAATANVKSSGWLVSVIGAGRGGKFRRGDSRRCVPVRAGAGPGPGPGKGERGDVARTDHRPVLWLPSWLCRKNQ